MGFAKSIKSLFKGKKGAKEKEDNFNPYENSKQKATVGRNKSMRMGIYEPYRSHFPLRQNPIPFDKSDLASDTQQQSQNRQKADSRYSYDTSRMKLVTANGEFTRDRNGNYEQHIPAHQPQVGSMAQRRGPQSMYGSTDSIHSGIQQLYTSNLGARNGQLRGSTRSLDQYGGQMEMLKNGNGRMSLRGNMGSNSISNMQQCQYQQYQQQQYNPNVAPQYQMWQPQFQQPSSRPGSVDPYQMMSSSSTSLNSSAYGFMSPTPQQQQQQHHQSQQHLGNQAAPSSLPKVPSLSLLTGLNFDPSGRPMTSDPNEIAQAVKKMEQCLQMLNSLQRNNSQKNYQQHNLPNGQIMQQQQQQQHQRFQQQMLQPRAPPSLSAQPLRSSLRKPAALQPQPEFQEREARKKRRLRKKSDLSKFDLSELRKKLESVENDSTDSGGDSNGDKGFCDGSNPPSDGTVTPEKRESGSDSGESSDSGVSTPPPADLKIEKELKPILSVSKGILKRTNSH